MVTSIMLFDNIIYINRGNASNLSKLKSELLN